MRDAIIKEKSDLGIWTAQPNSDNHGHGHGHPHELHYHPGTVGHPLPPRFPIELLSEVSRGEASLATVHCSGAEDDEGYGEEEDDGGHDDDDYKMISVTWCTGGLSLNESC